MPTYWLVDAVISAEHEYAGTFGLLPTGTKYQLPESRHIILVANDRDDARREGERWVKSVTTVQPELAAGPNRVTGIKEATDDDLARYEIWRKQ